MEDNKKKKNILIIGIIFLVIVLIGSTYAFFTYSRGSEAFVLTTHNGVSASFTEGTNQINFTNAYPISNEYAIANLDKLDYVDFTVSGNSTNQDESVTYEIYLTEKSGNSLSSDYIRVYLTDENDEKIVKPSIYSSLDNTSYSKDASTGKVIFKDTKMGSFTKNYKLYIWLDKDYEQNSVSQNFSFYVNIYAYNDTNKTGPYLLESKIKELKIDNPSCNYIVEDYDTNNELETTYLSGPATGNCAIDFNYVWWSGKMWRITAIYPDGAMKLITDNNITSIAFNESGNVTYYNKTTGAKSYMFQWLNEDFLDTLYNQGRDVIDTTKSWNATMSISQNIQFKPTETDVTMIPTTTSPVGLLNSYELYKSYQKTTSANGYLNIGYFWWLLNSYYNETKPLYIWYTYDYGEGGHDNPYSIKGIRPSIYLKSGIYLSGSGTKESPYRLPYDYNDANINDEINTRHSGEYVKLKNNENEQLFRIVNIENDKTKLVVMDYADNKATRKFATSGGSGNTLWGSGTTTGENTLYTYLNGTYYPNLVSTYGDLFDSNLYYLGTSGYNYKLSVCANKTSGNTKVCDKTSQTGTFNIGLLRYGEMFATQQGSGSSNSINMWLINRYDDWDDVYIDNNGEGDKYSPTTTRGARPTLHLKSTVKILSGTGTELDPYVVGL